MLLPYLAVRSVFTRLSTKPGARPDDRPDLLGSLPRPRRHCPRRHYSDAIVFQFTGNNPRTDELFLDNEPHVGGWGTSLCGHGEDGMIWTLSGNFHDMPIEVFESKFPARITDYSYRQDSAGPGQWRGGNGIIREYQMTPTPR